MSNGRNHRMKGSRVDSGRDSGGFVALPWSVIDSPAYRRLSHPAKTLLLEVARQFVKDNNGRLLLSGTYMATRGWKSNDTLTKCKVELLNAGLIFETVKGHRPNKASWYAVTWRKMDKIHGYDTGAEQLFVRGAYEKNMPVKIASLTPPNGVAGPAIAPPNGVKAQLTTPPSGAIRTVLPQGTTPPYGDHLDMPSTGIRNTARIQASDTTMGRILRCVRPKYRPPSYYVARANLLQPVSLKASP